jgi:hypothetical protein
MTKPVRLAASGDDMGVLTTDVALRVAPGGAILVPEIRKPFPIVLKVVQEEEEGCGWAGGVTG